MALIDRDADVPHAEGYTSQSHRNYSTPNVPSARHGFDSSRFSFCQYDRHDMCSLCGKYFVELEA